MDHELLSTLQRIDKMYRRGIITGGQALNQQFDAVSQFALRWGRLAAAVTDAGAIAAGELSVVHSADLTNSLAGEQDAPAVAAKATCPTIFGAMRPRA